MIKSFLFTVSVIFSLLIIISCKGEDTGDTEKTDSETGDTGTAELAWSNKAPTGMTWMNAMDYCNTLVENGKSDWRMATISELRSLVQNCPATETGGSCTLTDDCLLYDCYNSTCKSCEEVDDSRYSKIGDKGWFWSSSVNANNDGYAYSLDFKSATIYDQKKNNPYYYVRCVR